jgi:crotonobetainyl-CoA:carnitine CoA-transferase CaiB-like acyl-CoA transferase
VDYPSLAPENPRLIYASISGYGQTGPSRAKGGFDLIAQGESGLMSVTGESGGGPVKVGVPITDLSAGFFALIGILAALHYRARTGLGQLIDTSLLDAGVALSMFAAAEYFSGSLPTRLGSAHRLIAPYQAIRCADGYVTLGTANDRLFRRLCEILQHPEWGDAPEFRDNTARMRHRGELVAMIEAITVQQPRSHWLQRLEAREIPCGPINDYAQVFADPQVAARDMVVDTDHPVLGRLKTLGSAIKLSATPAVVGRRAPLLGEHTDEVLGELGIGEEERAVLRRNGAVA